MDTVVVATAASSMACVSTVIAVSFIAKSRGVNLFRPSAAASTSSTSSELIQRLGNLEKNLASSESRLTSSIAENNNSLLSHLQTTQHHSHETLTSLSTRLQKLNETSNELKNLTVHVDDLKQALSSPRARGVLGEQQLEDLIMDSLPPSSYSFQASLPHPDGSTVRPDVLLSLPDPIGCIAVDAKYPLNAFQEILAVSSSETVTLRASQSDARKRFKAHLTKHLKDVSSKYVIPPVTSSAGAILFLPSEAVFSEVVSHHTDLVKLAHKLNVWLCSPTTLMAVLTTMRGVTRDVSLQQKSQFLVSELNLILRDVDNVVKRAVTVGKRFEQSKESLRLLEVSAEKVRRRGMTIRNLENGMEEEGNSELPPSTHNDYDDSGEEVEEV
eukprot:CAMPEP_0118636890 /NCGR_PEP_ID=MMETSP0785-20121206/2868_1 /TAXON_ID=91992 /ORGANISM="Bolidomonas pacifica, Strain CCMP 1866" /LENGTH=384 /DNA_ID=CAMNT_0006528055 /DNA_START=271 /DNA_END=1422 /DNA_ORIENTATION=+